MGSVRDPVSKTKVERVEEEQTLETRSGNIWANTARLRPLNVNIVSISNDNASKKPQTSRRTVQQGFGVGEGNHA